MYCMGKSAVSYSILFGMQDNIEEEVENPIGEEISVAEKYFLTLKVVLGPILDCSTIRLYLTKSRGWSLFEIKSL